jgi:S-formylglutathione hydrolase FrmB
MQRPVRFCALLPPSFDREPQRRYPVLYFLHGLGENEQSFVEGGGWNLLEHMRDAGQVGEFVVIAPDGGSTFYVNSRDGRRPWETFFLTEFMPAAERRYRALPGRGARGITGVSMGGYGALHLGFAHPQLFGAVSAQMPALMKSFPPGLFSGGELVNPRLRVLENAFGRPFDVAYWNRNSPITLARTATGLPHIYFDCGREDDYGFDAGATALHEALQARRIPHEFHLYPGGHDWRYVAQHLPAALAFHWKHFPAR